jgi:hypothetical protein
VELAADGIITGRSSPGLGILFVVSPSTGTGITAMFTLGTLLLVPLHSLSPLPTFFRNPSPEPPLFPLLIDAFSSKTFVLPNEFSKVADNRFAARLRLKIMPLMIRPVRTKAPATEALAIVTAEAPLDDVGTL